jgi:peptidoglycan hydrolase-like protein with peptidoglycan-binding domain
MPTAADIRWFKEQFHTEIESAVSGTPFDLDMLTALACQETGEIWPILRKKPELTVAQIVELCVGDTLDSDRGRRAFPKTKAELVAAPNGQAMFRIARKALVDMAAHIRSYRAAARNPTKFVHGFGVWQYDLQFFKTDPQYFLEKRYALFGETLKKALEELRDALKKRGFRNKPSLNDREMAEVAIVYNTGGFNPAKGLKQGFKNADGRFYGEEIFDFIRLSRTVTLPPAAVPIAPSPIPVGPAAVVAEPLSPAARPFRAAEAAVANAMAGAAEGVVAAAVTPPPLMAGAPILSPPQVPVTLRALRPGSQGDLVHAWQSFLLGQGFDPGGLDGNFGDKTVAATKAFQRQHGVSDDGIAGRETIMRAMQLGFELIEEPASDMSGSNFPPRPDFPPLLSTTARQAVFGRFDFVAEPRPDNRENIRILGTWERDNIINVPIPQLRAALGSRAPAGMRFHRLAAQQLKELWADWERANLLNRVVSFDGSFVPRFIRGSTTNLSNHAFGSAFDINADENPLGARPKLVGQRGSTRELVPLANKWGFYWGGHFGGRPDGMHFEIAFLK